MGWKMINGSLFSNLFALVPVSEISKDLRRPLKNHNPIQPVIHTNCVWVRIPTSSERTQGDRLGTKINHWVASRFTKFSGQQKVVVILLMRFLKSSSIREIFIVISLKFSRIHGKRSQQLYL